MSLSVPSLSHRTAESLSFRLGVPVHPGSNQSKKKKEPSNENPVKKLEKKQQQTCGSQSPRVPFEVKANRWRRIGRLYLWVKPVKDPIKSNKKSEDNLGRYFEALQETGNPIWSAVVVLFYLVWKASITTLWWRRRKTKMAETNLGSSFMKSTSKLVMMNEVLLSTPASVKRPKKKTRKNPEFISRISLASGPTKNDYLEWTIRSLQHTKMEADGDESRPIIDGPLPTWK